MDLVKIATRSSKLAMAQSKKVAERLKLQYPQIEFKLVELVTRGDKDQITPISQFSGSGVFVKELERAILDGHAHMAVHSLKDVPAEETDGLSLVSFPQREDARDVLVSRNGISWRDLPKGAIVGTSSPGRLAQLKRLRPDLQFKEIRGNVDTRIKKVKEGRYDATILAAAGLNRLGIPFSEASVFQLREMVPSPGQGALALQCRSDDETMAQMLRKINHIPTEIAVWQERQFMKRMDGGCRHPLAANIAIWGNDVAYRFMIGDKTSYEFEEVYGNCLVNDLDALVEKQSEYFLERIKELNYMLK